MSTPRRPAHIHAADLDSRSTLCGRLVEDLTKLPLDPEQLKLYPMTGYEPAAELKGALPAGTFGAKLVDQTSKVRLTCVVCMKVILARWEG